MNTPRLSKRFDQALAYMMMLHRDQRRKGTEIPYVSHLLAVSGMVIENGGTEDEVWIRPESEIPMDLDGEWCYFGLER